MSPSRSAILCAATAFVHLVLAAFPESAFARGGRGSETGFGWMIAFAVIIGAGFLISSVKKAYPGFFPIVGGLVLMLVVATMAAQFMTFLGIFDQGDEPILTIALLVLWFLYVGISRR